LSTSLRRYFRFFNIFWRLSRNPLKIFIVVGSDILRTKDGCKVSEEVTFDNLLANIVDKCF